MNSEAKPPEQDFKELLVEFYGAQWEYLDYRAGRVAGIPTTLNELAKQKRLLKLQDAATAASNEITNRVEQMELENKTLRQELMRLKALMARVRQVAKNLDD